MDKWISLDYSEEILLTLNITVMYVLDRTHEDDVLIIMPIVERARVQQ